MTLNFQNEGQTDPCTGPGVGLDHPFSLFQPGYLWFCESRTSVKVWKCSWAHPPFVSLTATIKSTGGGRSWYGPSETNSVCSYFGFFAIRWSIVSFLLELPQAVFCTYSSPFRNRKKLSLNPQSRISEEWKQTSGDWCASCKSLQQVWISMNYSPRWRCSGVSLVAGVLR